MGSDDSGFWNTTPRRPFPAKVWLEQRYAFHVPAWVFAPTPVQPACVGSARRPFPAKVWLEQRRRRAASQTAS